MNGYINYIIEANIGLTLFLAVYHILLRGETNFRLLRMFMLAGIFVSLLFPLLTLQSSKGLSELSMRQVMPAYWLPEMSVRGETKLQTGASAFHFWNFAVTFYATGFVLFALGILLQLGQLLRIVRRSKTYALRNLRIAESYENKPTFSFFNFIFIGNVHALSSEEKEQVLQHEAVHAREWHSLDILLIGAVKVLFWFNPFINTYKKALIQLHEFEADAQAVKNSDVNKYCSLLARVALESADIKLANHFNSSLTVKRISMIRSPKNTMRYWKVAACALVFPASLVLLSCQDQLQKSESPSGQVFSEVDEPAKPREGLEAFYNLVKRNIRYPAKSRADHKYGKVLVQFVVNENGSLSDMEVLDSPDELLGNEAVRVLQLSPAWIPAERNGAVVKQRLVLPIEFKLDIPGQELQQKKNTGSAGDLKTSLKEIVVVGYVN